MKQFFDDDDTFAAELLMAIVTDEVPFNAGVLMMPPLTNRPELAEIYRMALDLTNSMDPMLGSENRAVVVHSWNAWLGARFAHTEYGREQSLQESADTLLQLTDTRLREQILRSHWRNANQIQRLCFLEIVEAIPNSDSLKSILNRLQNENLGEDELPRPNGKCLEIGDCDQNEQNNENMAECAMTSAAPILLPIDKSRTPIPHRRLRWEGRLALTITFVLMLTLGWRVWTGSLQPNRSPSITYVPHNDNPFVDEGVATLGPTSPDIRTGDSYKRETFERLLRECQSPYSSVHRINNDEILMIAWRDMDQLTFSEACLFNPTADLRECVEYFVLVGLRDKCDKLAGDLDGFLSAQDLIDLQLTKTSDMALQIIRKAYEERCKSHIVSIEVWRVLHKRQPRLQKIEVELENESPEDSHKFKKP
jgi:hypothetical protein